MLNKSPFSADDRAKRPNRDAHRSLGDLDASYRADSPTSPVRQERAKQIAVRDVSGSMTDEEPVHAFMVPNKYLKPNATNQMPPKRPLGARPEPIPARQPVKMYSQVATFDGAMPRIRRARTAIPVAEKAGDETWFERMQRFGSLVVALAVAGALFVWDKLQIAWHFVSRKFHVLVIGPTRTTYGLMRGVTVKRYGIEQSRFRIVVPVALLLLLFGVALLNSLVGENWLPGHHSKSANTGTQQGNAVLQITPTSSGGKGSGSGSNAAAQGGNGTPQAASQATQAAGSRGSGLQSSPSSSLGGASSAVGGLGGGAAGGGGTSSGGSGSGISAPVTVPPVTEPSVPSVPSVPSTPVTTGGSGGSGGSGGGTGNPVIDNTLNQAGGAVNNVVNQAPQTLNGVTNQATNAVNDLSRPVNNVTQPVTNVTQPVTSQVQQTTSGLGL